MINLMTKRPPVDSMGNLIDMRRPILQNEDGSFSTEETITVDYNGRWFNIPTIVNGVRVDEDSAYDMFVRGENPHVGEYETLDEAVSAARQRTQDVGSARLHSRGRVGYPAYY